MDVKKNKNNKTKISSLQGLRLYAFLGIFLSHIGIIEWGPWGVSIFLVLSGFLMTYNYIAMDLPAGIVNCVHFAVNKLAKLYPLHIIMMVSAIVMQTAKGMIFYSPQRGIIDGGIIGLHLFLAQSWIPRSGVYFSLNGVSWFLGVSLFCYFIFPFILDRIRTYKSSNEAIKYMIIIYLIQIVVAYAVTYIYVPMYISKDFTKWVTYVCPAFRLGDFTIGCNLGYLFVNRKNSDDDEVSRIACTVIEIIIFGVSLLIPYNWLVNNGMEWIATDIIYIPFSLTLVWLFATEHGYFSRLSSKGLFILGGGLTPYAFLIHFQVVMDWLMFTSVNKWLSILVCLIITFTLSALWKRYDQYSSALL